MAHYNKVSDRAPGHQLTQDERGALIEELHCKYLFDIDRLLEWLQEFEQNRFWDFEVSEPSYSKALSLFLESLDDEGESYGDSISGLAEQMWEVRRDDKIAGAEQFGVRFSPVMDTGLMLLASQVEQIKAIRGLDEFQRDLVDAGFVKDYAECLMSLPVTDSSFGSWAMEWLGHHLRLSGGERRKPVASESERAGAVEAGSAMVNEQI
jgi:hypothetical protein